KDDEEDVVTEIKSAINVVNINDNDENHSVVASEKNKDDHVQVLCVHDFGASKFIFNSIYAIFSLCGTIKCMKVNHLEDVVYILMNGEETALNVLGTLNYRYCGPYKLRLSIISMKINDMTVSSVEEVNSTGINYESMCNRHLVRRNLPDLYPPTNKLYVCNISLEVSEDDLRRHFKNCGFNVYEVTLMENIKVAKQYAYVKFGCISVAIHALMLLHYSSLKGENIYLSFAPYINKTRLEEVH
ncbi:Polypyrimidine tract-binding protein 1, partial [Frankliniella fusca]